MQELLPSTAHLPDAFIRIFPVIPEPVQNFLDIIPGLIWDAVAILRREVDGIEEFTVDVELKLCFCSITDSNGLGTAIACKVVSL
jgi:hypothetical protein